MTRTFSQQDMDDFGLVSGGTGLIHTEPDFAATTRFGATLVQGVFLQAAIEAALAERLPGWAERGELEIRFVAPVTQGTPFTVELADGPDAAVQVTGSTPAGPAVVGTARLRG